MTTTANAVAMLQVRIGKGRLEKLKGWCRTHGCSMTEVVSRWIDQLGVVAPAGTEPVPGAGAGHDPGTSDVQEVVQGDVSDQGDGTKYVRVSGDLVLEELQKQTALLQQLVGAGVPPAVVVTAAMPVVLTYEAPALAAEAAVVQPGPEPEVVPTPADSEAEDHLAATTARQLKEMEVWAQQQAEVNKEAIEAERVAAHEAAGHQKPAGNAAFAQMLKEAAAAAREQVIAEPEVTTPVGGDAAGEAIESVADQEVPEPEVLTGDDQTIAVDATPVDLADSDLEARVEALEKQEKAMRNWLQDIEAGGDPIAPPLPDGASEGDWEAAASDCLVARGRKPLPEMIEKVLAHWGRGS